MHAGSGRCLLHPIFPNNHLISDYHPIEDRTKILVLRFCTCALISLAKLVLQHRIIHFQHCTVDYSHYTLDGRSRKKRRGNTSESHELAADLPVETEKWNDWTSTWRKVGNAGHRKDVTLTGTITRGKKRGQTVDVQLNLTNQELMEISHSQDNIDGTSTTIATSTLSHDGRKCGCGLKSGPHIVLLSIICLPFIFIASFFTSFYFGALTWQNVFNYFYDERTICHRIFVCPFLVVFFPPLILLFSLGIATYAAFVQIWWSFEGWKREVSSFEKGFYGWFCDKLGLEDCCPYQVVELYGPDDSIASSQERILNGRSPNNRQIDPAPIDPTRGATSQQTSNV